MRQKPTNYIIRNKAKYVKQNRVNTDTYLPTISLICRCFSKVIKTVNIRFMLACVPLCSNWKRLDNRERRFRRTEKWTPLHCPAKQSSDLRRNTKKNSLNDAARTWWQGSRDKNNRRWHHQQKWTQPKPIGDGSVVQGVMGNGSESQLSVLQ